MTFFWVVLSLCYFELWIMTFAIAMNVSCWQTNYSFPYASHDSSPSNATAPTSCQKVFFAAYYTNFLTYVAVATALCLVAVFSNLLCLAAICTWPELRRQGNILVTNLVVVDLLLSLTSYPISIAAVIYRQYSALAENFCDWTVYYHFVIHSFVWHECLLAVNRLVAVVFPHRYNKLLATRSAVAATLVTGYLIAFCINAYPLGAATAATKRVHMYVPTFPFESCLYNVQHAGIFPIVHAVLGVYLPMSVIGLYYGTLFLAVAVKRRLNQSGRRAWMRGTARSDALLRKRTRLARMLFVSFLWNAMTYLPQPLLTAFLPDVYSRWPTSFFYVRWILQLGVAGNTVSNHGGHKPYTSLSH